MKQAGDAGYTLMAVKVFASQKNRSSARSFGFMVPAKILAFAAFTFMTGGEAANAQLAVASDFRLGIHAQKTRLVIELSQPVKYHAFTLVNPDRIVIDMPEIDWRMRPGSTRRAEGLVGGFRFGLVRPGTSRVVLDLRRPGFIEEAFLLPPRGGKLYRFVLDIVPGRQSVGKSLSSGPTNIGPPPRSLAPRPKARPVPRRKVSTRHPHLRFPSPTRKPYLGGDKRHVVVIDPGHGGIDPGAIGRSGILEKNITLAAARAIEARLERTGRYKVLLTRDRDMFIQLRDRVAIAREKGAALFVSLHADTIRNKHVRGLSVYTLSKRASDKEAAELAERENKADVIAGIDLSDQAPSVTNILIDLAQRETMNDSARAASFLVSELRKVSKLLRNTHRFAGFRVLKAPDVPSILIEMGFLSNARDERSLKSPQYRKRLAAAVTRGIDAFFARVEQADRQ
ncbi:MAG: N-acetylmuramoyl-L-alanine amidase [Pseudomonadota bacterium]|nr:N-acetylmuramoyl-L-alanine amidase [Pseudomonadota bacterium]